MGILDDIRAFEMPGKRGGDFCYAQAIYGNFSEIEKLKAEGFSLTTVCKFLEKKGALPPGADPRSFRRAFRREIARRRRAAPKEVLVRERKSANSKENIPKRENAGTGTIPDREAPVIPTKRKNNLTGRQVNPDGTFMIAPVDLDDLPDFR